jgi:hypothetical protein
MSTVSKNNKFQPGFRTIDGTALNDVVYKPRVSAEDGITAHAGGGQTNAYVLYSTASNVTVVANANDSVKLIPATGNFIRYISNSSSTSMQVYGSGTDTINGVAYGTGVALAGGKNAVFYCTFPGKWFMVLSA